MGIYEEIFKNPDGAVCRYIIVPDGGGYFEGVKGVEEFSAERIIVDFPRKQIEVTGKNLTIKKYCDGDLHLSGNIYGVHLLQPPDTSSIQGETRR